MMISGYQVIQRQCLALYRCCYPLLNWLTMTRPSQTNQTMMGRWVSWHLRVKARVRVKAGQCTERNMHSYRTYHTSFLGAREGVRKGWDRWGRGGDSRVLSQHVIIVWSPPSTSPSPAFVNPAAFGCRYTSKDSGLSLSIFKASVTSGRKQKQGKPSKYPTKNAAPSE